MTHERPTESEPLKMVKPDFWYSEAYAKQHGEGAVLDQFKLSLQQTAIFGTLEQVGYSVYTVSPQSQPVIEASVEDIATTAMLVADKTIGDDAAKDRKLTIVASLTFGNENMEDHYRDALLQVADSLIPVEVTAEEVAQRYAQSA